MTRSVLDVWNIALSECSGRGNVALQEENTVEARICKRYYGVVRDAVQEASWWPSCKQTSRLSLAREREESMWRDGDPDDGKLFAYRLPNDLLRPWYLLDGSHFVVSQIDGEPMLHTDTEDGVLVYAKRVEDSTRWSVALFNATYKMLAAAISRPLRGSESLSNRLFQEAQLQITTSQADAANSDSNDYEAVPDWIAARLGRGPAVRYLYPFSTSYTTLVT